MRFIYFLIIMFISACGQNKVDRIKKQSHPSHKYTYVDIPLHRLKYNQTDYLPVYSDIYHRDGARRFMLATTISIRNTSLTDSAYIFKATYHDSYGAVLAEYIDSTLLLIPLESIEFVVHEDEQAGGAGANFIISWGATKNANQLLIQSVMIGTYGQQGISFITDAKAIENNLVH